MAIPRGAEDAVQLQINGLTQQVTTLVTRQQLNQEQNQRDIRELKDDQKAQSTVIERGFEKLETSLFQRVGPLEEAVIQLRLKWAKAVGYAMGVSALGAVVFESVKFVIEQAKAH